MFIATWQRRRGQFVAREQQHHGNRGFGRNAFHHSMNIFVEHNVAD